MYSLAFALSFLPPLALGIVESRPFPFACDTHEKLTAAVDNSRSIDFW